MTEVDGETETVASAEAERRRDARIRFRVTSTRRFILVATTLAGDAHGAFSIRIDYAPDVVEPTPVPILVGQTVTGRLDETSAVMENDGEASYDLYRFSGSNAQRVVVTLRSLEFDSSGRRRSCDGPVAELPSTQRSVIASMCATMAFTWASVSPSAAICFVSRVCGYSGGGQQPAAVRRPGPSGSYLHPAPA